MSNKNLFRALFFYLIFLLQHSSLARTDSTRQYDLDLIVCSGPLPTTGWPTGHSPDQYNSANALCVDGNIFGQLGLNCQCSWSLQAVCTRTTSTNEALWNSLTIRNFCRESCRCPLAYKRRHHRPGYWQKVRASLGCLGVKPVIFPDLNVDEGSEGKLEGGPGGGSGGGGTDMETCSQTSGNNPMDLISLGTCGGECKSPIDCLPPGVRRAPDDVGCHCVVKDLTQQFVRGMSNIITSVAVCALVGVGSKAVGYSPGYRGSRGLGLRGRSVVQNRHACPCNTSYVSYECCGTDGLVWERPEAKLGVLGTEPYRDTWGHVL